MGYQIGRASFISLSHEAIQVGESLGLPFICLMCKKWSDAYSEVYNVNFDGNLLIDDLKCNEDCYGPLLNGVFDKHVGPLSQEIESFCFYCGKPACFFIEKNNSDSVISIGICNEHIDILLDSVIYKKKEEDYVEKNKTRN